MNLIRFVLAHLTHLHILQMMTDTRYNSSSHDRCSEQLPGKMLVVLESNSQVEK